MDATNCPRCGTAGVVSIRLTMGEEHVVLNSCNTCDHRFWNRDGEVVELASVLSLAGRKRAGV